MSCSRPSGSGCRTPAINFPGFHGSGLARSWTEKSPFTQESSGALSRDSRANAFASR